MILALIFAACTYVDVHGHTQPCEVQQQCNPQTEHLHPKADSYTTQKDAWSKPVTAPGDGMCHSDSVDKPVHAPKQIPGGK